MEILLLSLPLQKSKFSEAVLNFSKGAVIIYDQDGGGRDMGGGLEKNRVFRKGL